MMAALGWFNVTDYGAVGNGSTDDTTAINSAIAAWNTATAGVLYFPHGTYKVTAALTTITAAGYVCGDGMGGYDGVDTAATTINCTSQTAVLFTVTNQAATFADLAIVNTYAGAPSAGSAIKVTSSNIGQKVDFDSIGVKGFYINIEVQTGAQWSMRNCYLSAPVLYGIKIQNTVNGDAGDWSISDSWFYAETYSATAAIRIESSGGAKLVNVKTNGISGVQFGRGIDLALSAATAILLVMGSSFENYSGDAIHLDINGHTFNLVSITGCQFGQYGNSTGKAFYSTGVNEISISGCLFHADTGTPTAISLNSGTIGYVGPMVNNGFGTLLATSSFTSLLDHSNS